MHRLSVIIPALHEHAQVGFAIRSAWQAGAEEVIVVDGGSEDRTVEVARREGANVITTARGRAVQQNQGARISAGDVLLFLHADNRLAPQSRAQIDAAMRKPRVVCGAFHQRIAATGWRYRVLERGNGIRARWWGVPYGDQGIFVRRDVFFGVGGFPEVPLMEDLLLMRTLRSAGQTVLLPGPLSVSARRWQQYGVFRQTWRNWGLITARAWGVPLDRLAKFYPQQEAKARTDVTAPDATELALPQVGAATVSPQEAHVNHRASRWPLG